MRNRTVVHRLLAAGFAMLLLSCGSTRHVSPARAEELIDFVLIIQEKSDGQVSHSWKHASEFDLSRYVHVSSTGHIAGSIVLASSRPRDCDQEHSDCFQD